MADPQYDPNSIPFLLRNPALQSLPMLGRQSALAPQPALAPPLALSAPRLLGQNDDAAGGLAPTGIRLAASQMLRNPFQDQGPPPAAPLARLPMPMDAASQNTNTGLLRAQDEQRRLISSGSGIHQIFHPVDENGNPTGQPVGLLRRIGGVAARIGEGIETALAPGAAMLTPGRKLTIRWTWRGTLGW